MWLVVSPSGRALPLLESAYPFSTPPFDADAPWLACDMHGTLTTASSDFWHCETATPDLPTNITRTNIAWLRLSGKSPKGLGIPPLRIKTNYDWVKPPEIHNVSREIGRRPRHFGSNALRAPDERANARRQFLGLLPIQSCTLRNQSDGRIRPRKHKSSPQAQVVHKWVSMHRVC